MYVQLWSKMSLRNKLFGINICDYEKFPYPGIEWYVASINT